MRSTRHHHLVPFQPLVRELRPRVAEGDARRLLVTASKRRYRRPLAASSQVSVWSPLGQEGPPVVFMLAKAEPAGPADLKVVAGERGGQESEKEKGEDQR